MALITSTKFIQQKVIGFIIKLQSNSSPYEVICEIHSGAVPSSVDGWNPAANTGTLLATFAANSFSLDGEAYTTPVSGYKIQLENTPSPVTASGTGTATWAVFYNSVQNDLALLVEPSLIGGNGGLRLNTLSLTSGVTSVEMLDINVSTNYDTGTV